jgi:hypothetical protein
MSLSMLLLFSLNALSPGLSPSVATLTTTQIKLIERGYECCYTQEVIAAVQEPRYSYPKIVSTKIDLDLPLAKKPASKLSWTVLIGLQILDIYTTDSVLKYECVQELNPVLGKTPSLSKLIAVKLAAAPVFYTINKYYGPITDRDLVPSNFLLAAAVANNFNVWNKAKARCDLL